MKSQSCARWIVGSLIPLFDHRDAQTVMASHKSKTPGAGFAPNCAGGLCLVGRRSDLSIRSDRWLTSRCQAASKAFAAFLAARSALTIGSRRHVN